MCRGKCHTSTGLKNCINIWLNNTSYLIFYGYTQLSYNAYGLRPKRKMRTRLPTMPSERDVISHTECAQTDFSGKASTFSLFPRVFCPILLVCIWEVESTVDNQ